tara:strand:- start:349 stop:1263 length:915 start_codon:yes stop_codon:yes gene_type:complete
MENLSPIVLFVYSRKNILKKTIAHLKKNRLAKKSRLYIFSDGYKSLEDKSNVDAVRIYLKKIRGFKKIKIIFRKKNFGLAKNIILGVTEVIKIHGKAIILEDDIFVSPHFLDFMNLSLKKFKNEKKIWHINGWNYDFKFPKNQRNTFYWKGMHCWGWATWKDRWKNYKKNSLSIINNWSRNKIRNFNFDNSYNFWSQVLRNHNRSINTWAIFWYSSIFEKKGLCVSPLHSLTKNVGNDEFSTNIVNLDHSIKNIPKNFFKSKKVPFSYSKKVEENKFIYSIIKRNISSRLSLKNKIKFFFNNYL